MLSVSPHNSEQINAQRYPDIDKVQDKASLFRECRKIFSHLNQCGFDLAFNALVGYVEDDYWYVEDRFGVRRFLENPDIPSQFLTHLSAFDVYDVVDSDHLSPNYFKNLGIHPNGRLAERARIYSQIPNRPKEIVQWLMQWIIRIDEYQGKKWVFSQFENDYALKKEAFLDFLVLGIEKIARLDGFSQDQSDSGATIERTRWHITRCIYHSGSMDHWAERFDFPSDLSAQITARVRAIMEEEMGTFINDKSILVTPYPPLMYDFRHNPSVIQLWYNQTTRGGEIIDYGS